MATIRKLQYSVRNKTYNPASSVVTQADNHLVTVDGFPVVGENIQARGFIFAPAVACGLARGRWRRARRVYASKHDRGISFPVHDLRNATHRPRGAL